MLSASTARSAMAAMLAKQQAIVRALAAQLAKSQKAKGK